MRYLIIFILAGIVSIKVRAHVPPPRTQDFVWGRGRESKVRSGGALFVPKNSVHSCLTCGARSAAMQQVASNLPDSHM